MIAFAYRSGHIGFVSDNSGGVPTGALFLASGPEELIRPIIQGNARLAYDNETYLVPGCPEAQSNEDAYQAFAAFFVRINELLRGRSE